MKTGPYIPLFSVGPTLTKRLMFYVFAPLLLALLSGCSETYRLDKALQTISGHLIKTNPALGKDPHEITVLLKPKKPKKPRVPLELEFGCICWRVIHSDGTLGSWECEPGCTPPAEPVPTSIRR